MPTIILYTNTDKIRAVLGVSSSELSDQRIIDTQLDLQLAVRLADVFPAHVALAALNATVVPTPGPLPLDVFNWQVLQLYCAYYCAVCLLPAAQTIFFQQLTDGQTTQSRFQSDDVQMTIDRIWSRADLYAGTLNPAYSGVKGLGYQIIGVATPLYNPVTDNQAYIYDFINSDSELFLRFQLGLY